MIKSKCVYRNFYKDFFNSIIRKPTFLMSFFLLFSLFITGFIFSNFIDTSKQLSINFDIANLKPSSNYLFGTNSFGQNLLHLVLIGSYKTILLATISTFINIILGTILGIIWGSSKKFDSFMFFIKNFTDNTPLVLFYIIIALVLGDGFIPLLLVIILFGWIEFAYIIRNYLIIIKSKVYNKVSQLYHVPFHKIAINNYVPAVLPLLFNNIALCMPKIISLEIMISYFGFSFGSSNPSLGSIMYHSISNNTFFDSPHLFYIPFIFLLLINTCIYFSCKAISGAFPKEGL